MANLSENYLVQVDIQIAPSVIQQRFQPPEKKKKKSSLYNEIPWKPLTCSTWSLIFNSCEMAVNPALE